jgi:dynein heavy chain
MKAGGKDEGLCFLFTEGQITKEEFLVYLNDLLSSGEIADLFQAEDVDGVVNQVRPACKSEGLGDTPQACWKFFIDRVKRNLHMSLCFSPVGDAFRNRAKKFPALVNCTVIDWFHAWPDEALHSVADKFLAEVEMASDEIRAGITKFMPYSFKIVNEFSEKILDQERRFVYTTPKSFLELIKLFKVMYARKEGELSSSLDTYDTGVVKLTETGEVVAKLEEDLKVMSVEVEAKKKSADEQAEIVGGEKAKVEVENEKAEAEAISCNKIKTDVEKLVKEAQEALDKAEPLVAKAELALAGLDINDFRNLKALKKPPDAINETFTCVLHLLCSVHKDVPVKNGKLNAPDTWKVALGLMSNPQAFLDELMAFKPKIDDDKVPAKNFDAIRKTLGQEEFTAEIITKKSSAAGGLCEWIINIAAYYDVVVSVEPLRNAVREGNEKLASANAKKAEVDALVAKLNSELQVLLDAYNKAMTEKNDAIAAAEKCERKMSLATRLVSALGSEQERWAQSIIDIGELMNVIIGDVLLASAFVSYVGPFNKQFRDRIIVDSFMPFFGQNNIPMSLNSNPVDILTDDAKCAVWF